MKWHGSTAAVTDQNERGFVEESGSSNDLGKSEKVRNTAERQDGRII